MIFSRRNLVVFAAGAAALGVLLYVILPQPAEHEPVPAPTPPPPAASPPQAAQSISPPPTIPVEGQLAYQPKPQGGSMKDPEKVRAAAEAFNVPISFWGKVSDQDGRPLAGVKVRYSVRKMAVPAAGFPDYRPESYDLTTGGNGEFTITGKSGDSLSIDAVSKEGYQPSSREQRTFAYAQAPTIFAPDTQRPVVFTMVKAGDAVQLKRFTGRMGVPYDGTVVAFDSMTGRRGNGSLKISVLRGPSAGAVPERNYPWTLTMRIEGGGMMPVEQGAIYEAPEAGYESQVTYEMKTGVDWKSGVQREYYFKTAENLYGRFSVTLSLRNDEPDAFVSLSGAVNPSGARNLEPRSTAQTSVP